jgi:hypothetical protein
MTQGVIFIFRRICVEQETEFVHKGEVLFVVLFSPNRRWNDAFLRPQEVQPTSCGFHKGYAGVAQLVEHRICNAGVAGSIPVASSILQT